MKSLLYNSFENVYPYKYLDTLDVGKSVHHHTIQIN